VRRALALALLAAAIVPGRATAAAEWHSQQPTKAGESPLLGEVGDIELLTPNTGMLITAGNGGVPAGLFAYDGSGWYRYSTVCGGHEGRIAWAGPDEFWTISDQQAGQATGVGQGPPEHISLCHFKDGQVVASYAKPVGVVDSYLPLDAAACAGPSDCWFAGERLRSGSVAQGAFHLHWDGTALTAVPSLTKFSELFDPARSVFDLAHHQGSFYESVEVREGDIPTQEEEEREAEAGPSFLHRIVPGAAQPFQPLFGAEPLDFGAGGAEASELEGFHLTGGEGEDLWAISGSRGPVATAIALRLGEGDQPVQVPLEDPGALLGPEVSIGGAAAEPGADDAWVTMRPEADPKSTFSPARLTRIHGDGAVDPEVTLPAPGEVVNGEELGRKGRAGPVACVAAEQCWMATEKGWLFHLGPDPAQNPDPLLHVEITARPPDESLPVLPPIELPEDDSGANSKGVSEQEPIPGEIEELPRRRPALLAKIKQRLVDGTVLEMSFTLRAKAHVRLVAQRKGHVVARTRSYTMARGRRSLRLRLDPRRWPTKLDLQAHAVKSGGAQ
jgi:hypothetical protein